MSAQRALTARQDQSLRWCRCAVIAALALCALTPTPGRAEDAPRWGAGLRAGVTYSQLVRPTDPAGEPTLLYGSAFTGTGWAIGAHAHRGLLDVGSLRLEVAAGLMYSRLQGAGFAELQGGSARREITLTSHTLRVPVLARIATRERGGLGGWLALGPELLWGVSARAEVTEQGAAPPSIDVTAVTHLGLSAEVGARFTGGSWAIPLAVRVTWDPAVPAATRERFEGYQSAESPGRYQVGFDWQVLVLSGVDMSW